MSDDPFAILGVRADASAAELAAARRRRARESHPDRGGALGAMQALNAAYDEALRRQRAAQGTTSARPQPPRPTSRRVQHDSPSFVIGVRPAQAHEALLVVASWIGEVAVAASPDLLECVLDEPLRCWCRLDVLPEGEASSVSLIVQPYDDQPAPDIDEVRDAWVTNLNQL